MDKFDISLNCINADNVAIFNSYCPHCGKFVQTYSEMEMKMMIYKNNYCSRKCEMLAKMEE